MVMELRDIIAKVKVKDVVDYLNRTGWVEVDSPWDDTYVFGRPEPNKGVKVCVPKTETDYHWFYIIKDTAERISVFESRSFTEVLFSLLNMDRSLC